MDRRDVLKLTALGTTAALLAPAELVSAIRTPILDAHIHLFDPTRPGGIPWPTPADAVLYRPALPDRYRKISAKHGIVGAIAVEASPLATDNQWLLEIAAKSPIIVGVIGDLVPSAPDYRTQLDRLHANPLFLGIRYGNLWDRDLAVDLEKPGFFDGLKALAEASLVFESANPNPTLIRALLRIADKLPELRIVIDHLPHAALPTDAAALENYEADLRRLSEVPNVFVKLSEIPVVANGKIITDPAFYTSKLDHLWGLFGEDRVLFGSDWPNSDTTASFDQTLRIVNNFIETKSPNARGKYFYRNSLAVYRWHPRMPQQPAL